MSTKREIFIWKKDDDMELLREVVHEEPYKFPVGSTKRGAAWTKIADNLVQRGLVKATQRSVRNRFNNSDDGVSPSKKKSSHTNLVSMMEASMAMKKTEQEEHRQLRHRELDLRAAEMQQQQQFQTMLLHQQQQHQQQQQALNMAMLNTVNQLLKYIKNP